MPAEYDESNGDSPTDLERFNVLHSVHGSLCCSHEVTANVVPKRVHEVYMRGPSDERFVIEATYSLYGTGYVVGWYQANCTLVNFGS
jgi:hypothetical protein